MFFHSVQLTCRNATCLRRGLEQHEAVVVDRHVPEVGMREAVDFDEFAEKPARQIDEMNALIDQFAAAGALRLSAPLAVIAQAAAVAVAGPHEHQRTQYSGIDRAPGLLKCPVIAVIEANANTHIVLRGELRQVAQLVDVPCRGLLDEHVLSGADGSARDLGLQRPCGVATMTASISARCQQRAPVGAGGATRHSSAASLRGARQVRVDAMDQPGARQMLRPALANDTAPDDTDVQSLLSPGHAAILRERCAASV